MITKDVNKIKLMHKLGLVDEQVLSSVEKKPLVEIDNLSVNFKRRGKLFKAVKNVNLNIEEGEVLGLVGESGSGKTTIGRSTLSLWDHAEGRVSIDGDDVPNKRIKSVSKDNVWVYKKGQMIYQDPTSSLNRQKKVLDIVYEGLKNFKIIEKENEDLIKQETKLIKEAERNLSALESREKFEEFSKNYYKKNHLIEVISREDDKEINKLAIDYCKAKEIDERIKELEKDLSKVDGKYKNKINILKKERSSDKVILIEGTLSDKKYFSDAMNSDLAEFEKLKQRATTDESKVQVKVDKRKEKFFKRVTRKASYLPSTLRTVIPKAWDDIKGIEKAIKELDKAPKLNDEQKFYATSIKISLEVLLKKHSKLLTPLNTAAFDSTYIGTNDVLLERIHFYNTLLRSIEERIKVEEVKLKNSKEESILEQFYTSSIKYLEEYREIIISLIKEFASISYKVKELLLNHEENGIKTFYKKALSINKTNDALKAALITWKAEEAIKYLTKSIKKEKYLINKEVEMLKEELSELSKGYQDLLDPIDDANKLLEKELIHFEKDYKITEQVYKKELKKIELLEEAISKGKDKIKESKKILKNKKYKKEIATQRIKDTLLKVGLTEESINKYPSQFSGGQKQRIGIARTIITNPKYIVADEPISALDVSVQAQVINLLKDIHRDMGLTMLFIAHDLQMVHYISDKIAVIYRGTIVEYGDADKVYKSPKHPYTRSLIGAMPSIEEVGKPLEVSNYNWDDHEYNEFSITKLHEVEKDHFVFGTEEEIKKWK